MLSASQKKFQTQYLVIALAILGLLLALAAPRWEAIPTFSDKQDLTKLSAADVSAYRWQAMAAFYSAHEGTIPVTGVDLTTLSAADISAYRWQAMADFYAKQAQPKVRYGPPGR
jgi:type II secretory pathway pseudopilin PulG